MPMNTFYSINILHTYKILSMEHKDLKKGNKIDINRHCC